MTTTRDLFREAVEGAATRAKSTMPLCNGRIDAAVKLVLAGDVELCDDGTARVGSGSDASQQYTVNGRCECRDFPQAPEGWCKHRLARALEIRATRATRAALDVIPSDATPETSHPPDAASSILSGLAGGCAAPLPEAPASANCHILLAGRQVQITLRDTDETRLLVRLEQLLQRFPVEGTSLVHPATGQQIPLCQWHGKMKESTKAKNTWYCPSRMADGTYCQERWPAKGRN